MKLNNVICQNAKPTTKNQKLFDGGGLYLEVSKKGGKLWRLKYRYNGKEKRMALGAYPLISLKEARERREEAKKQLEQGKDPSIEKQQAKRQAILDASITFEDVAKEWHEAVKHKWTEKHGKSILRRIEMHLYPRIGKHPIKNISPQQLLNALKEIEKYGVHETTKRIRQYASQVFKYAVLTGKAEINAAAEIGGFLQTARVKHHAALTIEEIPEFLQKLNTNEARLFRQTRIAIELILLTFVRTSELIKATWDEFDLENKIWLIPEKRMKVKEKGDHLVPLANQTIKLLEELKTLPTSPSNYILSSPVAPRKHISDNTILYGLYRMGYKGKTTGHGFRALAMTAIKEKLGYRHEVVDRQLAHAHRNSIDAAYDRAQFLEERTQMMQDWASYIHKLNS